MKKYLFFSKNAFNEAFIFKLNTAITMFAQVLNFALFFFLWKAVYQNGGQVVDYSLEQLITYYFFESFLFSIIIGNDISWKMGFEIVEGNFSNFVLKPISYFWLLFFHSLGIAFFNFITYAAAFFVMFFVVEKYLIIGNLITYSFDLIFFVSISFVLNFLLFFIIGLTAFWIGRIWGLSFALKTVMVFLAGSVLSLDLLPDMIYKFANILPFKYLVWVPVGIATDKIDVSFNMIFIGIFWILFLFFLCQILYKLGLKKYEGYGA